MHRKVEAIIFDYDGVVVTLDKKRALQAAEKYADAFLIPPETILTDLFYDTSQNYLLDRGEITIERARATMQEVAWQGETQVWFDWWNFVDNCFCMAKPMRELLVSLQGHYRLALLTDNHIGFRQWLQHHPDIAQYFDVVVCSAEQKIKKPDSRIYLHTLSELGSAPSKTVYLDDNIYNISAAQALGIQGIHVVTTEQACNDLRAILALPIEIS